MASKASLDAEAFGRLIRSDWYSQRWSHLRWHPVFRGFHPWSHPGDYHFGPLGSAG